VLVCQFGLLGCGTYHALDEHEPPYWNVGIAVNADAWGALAESAVDNEDQGPSVMSLDRVPAASAAGKGAVSGQVFDMRFDDAQNGAADEDAGTEMAAFPQSAPVDFETAVLALYNLLFGSGGLLERLGSPGLDRDRLLLRILILKAVNSRESTDMDDAADNAGAEDSAAIDAVAPVLLH